MGHGGDVSGTVRVTVWVMWRGRAFISAAGGPIMRGALGAIVRDVRVAACVVTHDTNA